MMNLKMLSAIALSGVLVASLNNSYAQHAAAKADDPAMKIYR
jgi:hypothetical protein